MNKTAQTGGEDRASFSDDASSRESRLEKSMLDRIDYLFRYSRSDPLLASIREALIAYRTGSCHD